MQAPVSDEGLNDTAICKKGPLSPISYFRKLFFFFWNVHKNQCVPAKVMFPSEDPNLVKKYLLEKFLPSSGHILKCECRKIQRKGTEKNI